MARNAILLVLTCVISLLAGAALFEITSDNESGDTSPIESTTTSTSLHEIPLENSDGSIKYLGEWRQPVIIVNFWAPWCAPCRREIPALISLQEEYPEHIQILGIALDGADNVARFEAEHHMNYPSFLAGNYITMYNAAFSNHSGSIPFTAIVDQDRQIHYRHSGEISLEELRDKLALLL